jgi:ABC-type multidrug transport system permease subunit
MMRAIMWKEIRCFSREKVKLIVIILTSAFITFVNPFLPGRNGTYSVISPLVPMLLCACLFSPISFNTERYSRTLGSLLAAPLSVKDILLGKCFAIFLFSYPISLLMGIPTMILLKGDLIKFLLMLFIVTPISGFVLIELFCIAFVIVKNPLLLQYLEMFVTIGIVISMMNNPANIPTSTIIIFTLSGIALAFLLYILMGKINKEKMMRILL